MYKSGLFTQINDKFGRYLWAVSNRYATKTLSPGDIYNEVLIILHNEVCVGAVNLENTNRIKSIIISRSIDMCRREIRHFNSCADDRGEYENTVRFVKKPKTLQQIVQDKEFKSHLSVVITNELDFAILCEVIWPSDKTCEIAEKSAELARNESAGTTKVRMNCSVEAGKRVMKKHIAESLGISPARVTKALVRARENIDKILG